MLGQLDSQHHDLSELIAHVKDEVDALHKKHAAKEIEVFNKDEEYRKMSAEAFDSKDLAIKKIEFFIDSLEAAREDKTLLERIKNREFMAFALESTTLELQTGSGGFPWEQVP